MEKVINSLAYHDSELITAVKSFTAVAAGIKGVDVVTLNAFFLFGFTFSFLFIKINSKVKFMAKKSP